MAAVFPFVDSEIRLLVLFFALVTEYLDGALSRLFSVESKLGQLMDPIADKLFFASVAITFLYEGRIAIAQLLLLGARDILIGVASGVLLITKKWQDFKRMKAKIFGKITTVIQYAVFFWLFFRPDVPPVLIYLAFVFGIISVIQYFSPFLKKSS